MHKIVRQIIFIVVPTLALFTILPSIYSNHLLLFNFILYLILTQGLNIIYGFTGYLPFGYAGFFGAGAYGFAISVLHLQWPALVALLVAGAAGVVFGLVLMPLLRLSGAYFSIANLAAALVLLHVVSNPALESLTRGPYGISLAGVFNPGLAYGSSLVVLSATLVFVIYLKHSRFGLALQAIRDDPLSAQMAGVDVVRARAMAWNISAGIAGLGGGLFAWYVSVFYPETVFSSQITVFAIVFALFGGVGTVVGPLIGVAALYGLYNLIGISAPQYFQLIYGVLIMATVLFLPNGIVSILRKRGINVP